MIGGSDARTHGRCSFLGRLPAEKATSTRQKSAHREALGLTGDMALPLWVAVALAGLGGVAVDHGQAERGARLLVQRRGCARVGVYPQIWDAAAYERDVVAVRSVLKRPAEHCRLRTQYGSGSKRPSDDGSVAA